MKQIVILGVVVLALGAKWWDVPCPPCPEPVVCEGAPCFMGQRCDDAGCLPRVLSEKDFSSDTRSLGLDVTGQGGVALVGSFEQPQEGVEGDAATQTLMARLAPKGDMKWSRSYGVAGAPDRADAVRLHRAGDVWVAGTYRDGGLKVEGLEVPAVAGDDIYVLKRMGGGRALWIKGFGTAGDDRIHDLEVGGDGNGYLVSDDGSADGFTVRRLRPGGKVGWTKTFPGTRPSLGVYRDDQLYLVANFTEPTIKVDWQALELAEGDASGIYLARLDWDGDLVWALALNGDGQGGPRGVQDVAAMKDGDIVVSGFGALPGYPDAAGEGGMYVARLSPAGTPERIRRFGPPAVTAATAQVSLTPGTKDRLHVTGTCDGAFRWDRIRPRPDLEAARFVGTLEADGAFGSVLALPRSGPVTPMRAPRDDAGKLYFITHDDGAYRLVTLQP